MYVESFFNEDGNIKLENIIISIVEDEIERLVFENTNYRNVNTTNLFEEGVVIS